MRSLTLVMAMLATAAISLAGAITQYSSRSSFNTAVGTVTLEDFTSTFHFPINPGVLNSFTNQPGIGITPGTIQPGVTYSAPVTTSSPDFNIDAGGGFAGGFLDSLINGASSRALTATFSSQVGAFGFDTNALGGLSESILINFSGGGFYTTTLNPASSLTFFGFQSSSQDISSVVFQYNSPLIYGFALDNFAFTANGTAGQTVPEPTSIVLLGGGLIGLGVLHRKRREKSSKPI